MLANGPLATSSLASSATTTLILPLTAGQFQLSGYTDAAEDTHNLVMGAGSFVLNGGTMGYGEAFTGTIRAGAFALNLVPMSAAHDRALSARATSYGVTGASDTTRVNRVAIGQRAIYALAAAPATIRVGLAPLTPAPGVFALSGLATARVGHILPIGAGSIALGGNTLDLTAFASLPAARGRFLFAFPDTALARGRVLAAGPGAFALAGRAARAVVGSTGRGSPTTYVVSGASAILAAKRTMTNARAVFAMVGEPTAFAQSLSGAALVPGQIVLNGASVALARQRALVAAPGVFEMIARDTSFGYDQDEVVTGSIASMSCTMILVGQSTWSPPAANPVNGLVMRPGRFGVTPSIAGLGRTMPLASGGFSVTGATP